MPTPDPAAILRRSPDRHRAAPARGLRPGRGRKAVDPEGGDLGAGLLRGVAVVTRGEALGHGHWIDPVFLDQVALAINQAGAGLKVRFTHPDLSADGLGRFLGRAKNGRVEGDVTRADIHLAESAHDTPDGDLAGYVLRLAEEDPAAFGTSIVFDRDTQAEKAFLLQHGATEDEDGLIDLAGFRSPDGDNENNFRHVRLARLLADDVVDSPAANPEGLFHRGAELAADADALAAYALGLQEDRPRLARLDMDPDRVAQFVARFLDRHGLEITTKRDPAMSKPTDAAPPPADHKPTDQNAAPPAAELSDKTPPPASAPAADAPPPADALADAAEDAREECRRYIERFGDAGARYFADGLTYEEALEEHVDHLETENTELGDRLAALGQTLGETEPAEYQEAEDGPEAQARKEAAETHGDGLAPLVAQNAKALARPAPRR